ncbi:MAG TPA: hypothetical protein VHZ24_06815 [Pirellulales bacterium]|jgi:hypothetical protein|nr:hypothetical protein [Pirellulales bacterium]
MIRSPARREPTWLLVLPERCEVCGEPLPVAMIAERWSALPEALKAGIAAMVGAAGQGGQP